jgi:sulfur carrier protein ThiS
VIARLGLPPEGSYLVIHNGTAVPKDARAACALADGDELAIMPPLKGG